MSRAHKQSSAGVHSSMSDEKVLRGTHLSSRLAVGVNNIVYRIAFLITSGSRWNFHVMSAARDSMSGLEQRKKGHKHMDGEDLCPKSKASTSLAPKVRQQEQPRRHGPHQPKPSSLATHFFPSTSHVEKKGTWFRSRQTSNPSTRRVPSHPPPPPRVALPFFTFDTDRRPRAAATPSRPPAPTNPPVVEREEVALSARVDSSVDFPLVIHGLSIPNGIILAQPNRAPAEHPHRPRLLPTSLLPHRRPECGCQSQHQQPHRQHPHQNRRCPGLPAAEHHQGGQRRPSQVGRPNRIPSKGALSLPSTLPLSRLPSPRPASPHVVSVRVLFAEADRVPSPSPHS